MIDFLFAGNSFDDDSIGKQEGKLAKSISVPRVWERRKPPAAVGV